MYAKCPICNKYDFLDSHRCHPVWYGLHQDEYGSSDYIPPADIFLDEGMRVYARDAEQAAIAFASRYQGEHNFYPSDMAVLVMDKDETKVYRYVVYMEQVPSYSVSLYDEPQVYDVEQMDGE